MTTMERAARAAFEAIPQDDWDGSRLTWEAATEDQRAFCAAIARAVLMAVREPSTDANNFGEWHTQMSGGTASSTFTAMIDAILNEGEA